MIFKINKVLSNKKWIDLCAGKSIIVLKPNPDAKLFMVLLFVLGFSCLFSLYFSVHSLLIVNRYMFSIISIISSMFVGFSLIGLKLTIDDNIPTKIKAKLGNFDNNGLPTIDIVEVK